MKENLLLLHGALGNKQQFKSLKDELSKTYKVYDLNFEGHGDNVSTKEFSMDLFTNNVIDFLNVQSIDTINIFGYSMGGYVALNMALKHPNKVSKIYTLGTKFNWDMASAEKEVSMLNPNIIQEKVPFFAEKLKTAHAPQDWKEVMNKTARMMINMAKGAKLLDSDFKQIPHPIVIGIGTLDKMVSLEESEHVSNLLPQAKLVQLKGGKHPIDKVDVGLLVEFIVSN